MRAQHVPERFAHGSPDAAGSFATYELGEVYTEAPKATCHMTTRNSGSFGRCRLSRSGKGSQLQAP